MKIKCMCALAAMVVLLSVKAETYRKLPGANDWTSPTSYAIGDKGEDPQDENGVVPGADDVVFVTDSTTNHYVSAADAAQWAVFNGFGRMRIKGTKARVVVDVPSGEAAFSLRVNYVGSSNFRNLNEAGGIIKRGAGTLVFNTPQGLDNKDRRSDHECYVEVEGGSVALSRDAVTFGSSNYAYGKFVLNKGTRLYFHRTPTGAGGFLKSQIWGLEGEGELIAEEPGARLYIVGGFPCSFSGAITGDIDFFVGGLQTFARDDLVYRKLTFCGDIIKDGALAEWDDRGPSFVKIGNPGEPSSFGTNVQIAVGNSNMKGGALHYIGEGETSAKNFYVGRTKLRPFFLDAGGGGLTLTGKFSAWTEDQVMERIVLEGDGPRENKITGALDIGTTLAFIITKRGKGTWGFENTRANRGALYVQDGTLKFDSVGETNEISSLGYSTLLTRNVGAAPAPENRIPYAFTLGDVNADGAAVGKGMMEYTGANTGRTTTRLALLNGAGGFANNGDASFRLAGVDAGPCTNNTLYLDGAGTNGNELQDLSGEMSIVKDGEGTWFLSGSNTVSGTVTVNGGTLWVRDPAKYTWFRWTVFNNLGATSDFKLQFFGLYDAEDRLVSGDLGFGANCRRLAPGEVHIDDDKVFSGGVKSVTNMLSAVYKGSVEFNLKQADNSTLVVPVSNATDRTMCFPFLMRLRDGANDVVSYDYIGSGTYRTGLMNSLPTDWMLEASSDGLRWDVVANRRENYLSKACDHFWRTTRENVVPTKGETSFATHAGGEPLIRTRRDAADVLPVFDNVTSVKVAKGATLKTDPGADIALRGIEADAAGAGTIENFRIAESGTLAISGVEKGVREFKLPVTLANVADKANFANWGFTINGSENPSWDMVVDKDGNVRFRKKGLVLIFR